MQIRAPPAEEGAVIPLAEYREQVKLRGQQRQHRHAAAVGHESQQQPLPARRAHQTQPGKPPAAQGQQCRPKSGKQHHSREHAPQKVENQPDHSPLTHRPAAPQGSAIPEAVQGRPSSSQVTFPPKRRPTSSCRIYPSTEGASPVV